MPLDEAVTTLIGNIGKAARLAEDDAVLVFETAKGTVRVHSRDGTVKVDQQAVPYEPHEKRAILEAARARAAALKAAERDLLRVAAAGN